MEIAGVEPVGYTNDKFMGPAEESNTNIVNCDLSSIDLPAGVPIYTIEQVYEILVKLLVDMNVEDVDGLSTLKTIPDKSLVTEQSERLVDEFLKMGD